MSVYVLLSISVCALYKSNCRLDNVSRVLNEDSSSDISRLQLFALFSCFQLVTTACSDSDAEPASASDNDNDNDNDDDGDGYGDTDGEETWIAVKDSKCK